MPLVALSMQWVLHWEMGAGTLKQTPQDMPQTKALQGQQCPVMFLAGSHQVDPDDAQDQVVPRVILGHGQVYS